MDISLIVAVSRNGVIGNKGQIPWHLSNDLKRFKKLTMGHHLIMGRNTYESIGKPLPGRTTIVLSHQPRPADLPAVVGWQSSLLSALDDAIAAGDQEPFICGGGLVYANAMMSCEIETLYRTVVDVDVEGDTFFVFPDEKLQQRFYIHETVHSMSTDVPTYRLETWKRKS